MSRRSCDEVERVDAELEVGRVAVHRRGDEARVDAEEVERALDVAGVVVEPGEVGVGAADGNRSLLLDQPLAERVDHVEDVIARRGVAFEPVLEVVVEVLVIDQYGGTGRARCQVGGFAHGINGGVNGSRPRRRTALIR